VLPQASDFVIAAGAWGDWGEPETPASEMQLSLADAAVVSHRYTQSLHGLTVAAMSKRRAEPDVRERFGTAVKFRREELGLTQEDPAENAGIHRTYLSDLERGTRNLSLINIEKLVAALSVSMTKLFETVDSQ
jgi:ribosome-binding protein aMBF1 (putative translation factor)